MQADACSCSFASYAHFSSPQTLLKHCCSSSCCNESPRFKMNIAVERLLVPDVNDVAVFNDPQPLRNINSLRTGRGVTKTVSCATCCSQPGSMQSWPVCVAADLDGLAATFTCTGKLVSRFPCSQYAHPCRVEQFLCRMSCAGHW